MVCEHCSIRIMLILPLSQSRSLFLIKAEIQLSNDGRLELAKMGKDGINAFVGRGQVMRSEAQDRSISPTALQFVV